MIHFFLYYSEGLVFWKEPAGPIEGNGNFQI